MGRRSTDARRFATLAVIALLLIASPKAGAQVMLRELNAQSPPAPGDQLLPLADADYPGAIDQFGPQSFGSDEGYGQPCCNLGACGPTERWPAGIELKFFRPQIRHNRALESIGGNNRDLDFEYDTEVSPRLWWGYERCDGLGWRIAWWDFDHAPDRVYAQPGANEKISTPEISGMEISSDTTTDHLLASSSLNAWTWDWEITKRADCGNWMADMSLGVRYAHAEQSYLAEIRNTNGVLLSQIEFNHWMRGVGPTVSLAATRFITCETNLFVRGRGSVLFGNHKSLLQTGANLNLTTPALVTRAERNGETLSIVEVQAGIGWQAGHHFCNPWEPFAILAFEGQLWSGPGNATTSDGDLGLVGVTMGVGCRW